MTYEIFSIEDIIHNYEQTRLNNRRLLQEREAEVYELIPRIREIDQEIALSSLQTARARLMGCDNDSSLKKNTSSHNHLLTEQKQKLLVSMGYPANYLEPIYKCSKCRDTGYVNTEKCSCFLDAIIATLYKRSNLKNILLKENFDTFSMEYYPKEQDNKHSVSSYDNMFNILVKAKQFVAEFDKKKLERGNILIYGETGLGKTFLTNCIAKEILDRGHTVLYLSANELFDSVISSYKLARKPESEYLYRYTFTCELLIIDDLGTELTNNFVLSQLFEIINQRQINGLSTLISTNLSMKQLRDTYTERIMSRIIADYTVFNIYGDNIRYQKRKKAINSIT